ncbi:hypothetical protein PHYPSEUDO_003037 [Phytophthora pseudosyringae]|uniref:Uncharacterized protein n=1 Tax=Phytophthora pseudosyringae TaxID=221518 RepID=A0A8T1VRK0_9STRA|nr:hypothetical protein PHYPSEUDO_003037 [Phytophthora pseudosyringae]
MFQLKMQQENKRKNSKVTFAGILQSRTTNGAINLDGESGSRRIAKYVLSRHQAVSWVLLRPTTAAAVTFRAYLPEYKYDKAIPAELKGKIERSPGKSPAKRRRVDSDSE